MGFHSRSLVSKLRLNEGALGRGAARCGAARGDAHHPSSSSSLDPSSSSCLPDRRGRVWRWRSEAAPCAPPRAPCAGASRSTAASSRRSSPARRSPGGWGANTRTFITHARQGDQAMQALASRIVDNSEGAIPFPRPRTTGEGRRLVVVGPTSFLTLGPVMPMRLLVRRMMSVAVRGSKILAGARASGS
jgi:hypothetical protein